MTEWAAELNAAGRKWFPAVSNLLNNRNRDAKLKLEKAKSPVASYPWQNPDLPGVV
jgi:hypothetical protein